MLGKKRHDRLDSKADICATTDVVGNHESMSMRSSATRGRAIVATVDMMCIFACKRYGCADTVGSRTALSCFCPFRRREALIEALAFRGEVYQQLVGRKARAVFLFQLAAQSDEGLGADHVDPRQCAAREGRKTETKDRADVCLAHVDEDFLLEAAGGFERLDTKQPQFQFLDVDFFGIEQFLRLQVDKTRP